MLLLIIGASPNKCNFTKNNLLKILFSHSIKYNNKAQFKPILSV